MYENSSILYLKPGVVDHDHVQQIEVKLKGMAKAGNKKVLLDLRDVAAGDMTEATRLAIFFLNDGTIAMLVGQKVQKQTFSADAAKSINVTAPVVVLVNRGTAGPAELVAAALLDNKRAELVGEKTFGEGAQQKTFELPDEGVTPGVLVASNQDQSVGVDDDGVPDTQAAPAKPSVTVDEQLTKALALLKNKAA